MVPYHKPIPEKKTDSGTTGLLGAWVQAEKMIQVALLLPCAAFIGWAAGYGLDRWLHQKWMAMAGAVFGVVAGLIGAVKMAIALASRPGEDGTDEVGDGKGGAGTPS